MDKHDWEGAEALGEVELASLAEEIDAALRQGMITAGKRGLGGDRAMTELLEAKVDWRTVLAEFCAQTCRGDDDASWRSLSRRALANDLLRQSHISTQVEELLLTADMSSSVLDEIKRYFTEFKAVFDNVRPKRVRVLYWDTKVRAEEVYGEGFLPLESFFTSTAPKGGGGTDATCVSRYVQEHNLKPQAIINFTDGHVGGQWGTWTHPVLWCIVGNKSATPTVGKYVHVSTYN